MTDIFSLAVSNLVTPIILSFALGLVAAFARSDLTIPEAVAKGMSIYLLFAIGFKGGAGVAAHGLDSVGLLAWAGRSAGAMAFEHVTTSPRCLSQHVFT